MRFVVPTDWVVDQYIRVVLRPGNEPKLAQSFFQEIYSTMLNNCVVYQSDFRAFIC